MKYEEWSKSIELDRTLTPNFAGTVLAEHKSRVLNTKNTNDTNGKEGKKMFKLTKLINLKLAKMPINSELGQLGQLGQLFMNPLCDAHEPAVPEESG